MLGEYVGRIYQQVRERPRYLIQAILEAGDEPGMKSERQWQGAEHASRSSLLTPDSR